MSLRLTSEQRGIVTTVREFAARECGTREQRLVLTDGGRNHTNPEIARKLADLGFLGLSIPEEYGGAGGGLYDACLFVEELAYNQIPVGSYAVTLIVAHVYLTTTGPTVLTDIKAMVTGWEDVEVHAYPGAQTEQA